MLTLAAPLNPMEVVSGGLNIPDHKRPTALISMNNVAACVDDNIKKIPRKP